MNLFKISFCIIWLHHFLRQFENKHIPFIWEVLKRINMPSVGTQGNEKAVYYSLKNGKKVTGSKPSRSLF